MTFEAVYTQHFRFVWRSLHRLGVPERDLSDAVQDVFLVVHRKLAEFEGRSKVETWLYGICLRVASDRRRRVSAQTEVLEAEPEDVAPGSSRVGRDLEHRERVRLLATILDSLPLPQRAVFVLFELEQLSADRIAELLDVPVGTVNSRLRLARQAFRRELERRRAQDSFRLRAGGT